MKASIIEAIRLAQEGGYYPQVHQRRDEKVEHHKLFSKQEYKVSESDIFMDICFWQALGKVKGWDEVYCKSGCGCPRPYGDGSHEFACIWAGENEWERRWHDLINHLILRMDIESYFKELLTT